MRLTDLQRDISQWGRETFGREGQPAPGPAIAARMNVEVAELLNGFAALELAAPEDREAILEELRMECGDIGIMLVQVSDAIRGDLAEYMRRKMEINRARTWGKTATGKVQHVDQNPAEVLRQACEVAGHTVHRPSFDAVAKRLGEPVYKLWKDEATGDVGVDSNETHFTEPGSGQDIMLALYYLVWDAGGLLTSDGFETAEHAKTFAHASGNAAEIPTWQGYGKGWEGMGGLNVLKGEHLYLYWAELEADHEQAN